MIVRWVALTAGLTAAALLVPAVVARGQSGAVLYDPAAFAALRWRNIGPNRGGRSIAATGVPTRPHEYYFGATGGGLWKTTDGGVTWGPVTDGQIRSSSVGAVAVSVSHPDVVYIGMGEVQLRGNVMQGDGVYRSDDAGRTWRHVGLADTQAIARIRVDPEDPDLVYVAALGHPTGPSEARGVFRSRDGGRTWERVLYRGPRAGAVDLAVDPSDPRVLYVALWEVYRNAYRLWSGGAGSGLFKSTDGGDTWQELTRNPGLPAGPLGKIGLAVSGADPDRLYAVVEATDGGLYRSDDGGATWALVNPSRDLWQRSFYFNRVTADPRDADTVYVLNFYLERSTDGGRRFERVATPHEDHHDLWIDPNDARRLLVATDGGGSVSVNRGRTWTPQRYPTAQLYHVATTRDFPYHVVGAQQDNSTAAVPSDGGPSMRNPRQRAGDFLYAVGGGENGYVVPHPTDPDVFYAGATNALTRFDRRTAEVRDIQPYPRVFMGEPAADIPERWNWVYPIAVSPVDPGALYCGSQHLWVTRDDGRSWRRISPDLTRADPETLGPTGGPIVRDQDGPEIYATLSTIAPSTFDAETVWVGSDDGLVHLTRDGGATWVNVTPPDMAANTRVGTIETSSREPGRAYVTARRSLMGDRAPYIWKTGDYGARWTRIEGGIDTDDFVHVVREDPTRDGLLYAGAEHGVHVSFDDGAAWQSLSLGLPDVQVADLVVEDRDLVIATHGRSFYVLDDITPLRQLASVDTQSAAVLFAPTDAVRPVYPAHVDYFLPRRVDRVRVEILDGDGRVIRELDAPEPTAVGLTRLSWDLRYPGATVFPGMILESRDPSRGPWARPGGYQVRLTTDGHAQTQPLQVRLDPRLDVAQADLDAQFELAVAVRDATSLANETIISIRVLRSEVRARVRRTDTDALAKAADSLIERIGSVEAELYQIQNQSPKDKIAFPIKLNDRLAGLLSLVGRGAAGPTAGHQRVFRELSGELSRLLERLDGYLSTALPCLNRLLEEHDLAPVEVP